MEDTAPELDVYEPVAEYDSAVVPRYAQPFAELLMGAVDLPTRANVLELACRTGFITVQLLAMLREGRMIALDDDAAFLEAARARAGDDVGRRLYLRKDPVEALPFNDAVFTNVVGNLVDRATTDRGALLSEAARVLRPQGQLVLTLPLRGSFAEVVDIFREVALKRDLAAVGERVEQYALSMPTPEIWQTELESHGFTVAAITERAFTLDFDVGQELLMDPATLAAAVAEWQWCAMGAEDPTEVLYAVQDAIRTYFHGRRFELGVTAGCVSARRTAP